MQDEINRLILMYRAITTGQDGLRQEFSRRWDNLREQDRAELVQLLLKKGLLPQEIGYALEVFNGAVVSLI